MVVQAAENIMWVSLPSTEDTYYQRRIHYITIILNDLSHYSQLRPQTTDHFIVDIYMQLFITAYTLSEITILLEKLIHFWGTLDHGLCYLALPLVFCCQCIMCSTLYSAYTVLYYFVYLCILVHCLNYCLYTLWIFLQVGFVVFALYVSTTFMYLDGVRKGMQGISRH